MIAPSLKRLHRDAAQLAVRAEMLEKAWRIFDLAAATCAHTGAEGRLALKGGTAHNLFVAETMPRLSVDADFHVVGAPDRRMISRLQCHNGGRHSSPVTRVALPPE